jgi:hypothetical protein
MLIPQISTYYEKTKLEFPLAFARPDTILSVEKEMIRINKNV